MLATSVGGRKSPLSHIQLNVLDGIVFRWLVIYVNCIIKYFRTDVLDRRQYTFDPQI